MEFASPHVYYYDDSDEEAVSDEEFEQGMTISDSDSDDDSPVLSPKPKSAAVEAVTDAIPMGGAAPPPPPAGSPGPPPPPPNPEAKKGGFLSSLFGGSIRSSGPARESKPKLKVPKKKSHWRSAPAGASYHEPSQVRHRWRRADTNVVSIKFNTLTAPKNMHTGDPIYCSNCKALLSHLSKLLPQEGSDRLWTCEFCGTGNIVDLVDEEIPKDQETTYMLQPAPTTTASDLSGADKSLVIFCVDISGSMCVTTEVEGKIRLRGDHLARLQSLNDTRESQYLPSQRRDVTYVSRLQSVQAAVDHQVAQMATEHPNRRVALITFNSEVTVIGDGTGTPVHLSGDKLKDKEGLQKTGQELPLPNPVVGTHKTLSDKVFDLEEGGATALGPALLLSIAMASQVAGSKVIICTDGKANVGLGSLENIDNDDQAFEQATGFYAEASQLAAQQGVCVSVISIKGTDCKMVELGKVADATNGQVNIVDPLRLTHEFGSILADPVIATNVVATLLVNKGLYIRYEETKENRVLRDVGNVTADSEITFEFGVRKTKHKKQKTTTNPPIPEEGAPGPSGSSSTDLGELKELPFQVQIRYTDLEGGQALRVLTRAQPITRDRAVAERAMDMALMGANMAQQSARMASEGMYTQSRLNAMMGQRLISRTSRAASTVEARKAKREEYIKVCNYISPFEKYVNQAQTSERSVRSHTYSDDEDEEEDLMGMATDCAAPASAALSAKPVTKSKKKALNRRKECSDEMSANVYSMMKSKSKDVSK